MKEMQIFIADVTDDFRLSKKRLIKKLEDMKAKVHYRLPPPFKMDLHDQTYQTTMANCEVSVHILSRYPGRTFEDPENVFISIHQAQVGLNGNNRKVFWIPKNLEFDQVDEEQYREFLGTLEFGIDDDDFILLKGDPQTLDMDIIKMIPFPKIQTKCEGILIVHHSKDEDGAIRVGELAKEMNIPFQYSSAGGDSPDSNLKILADQLKDVKQVVVVVGLVNIEWAKERSKHILSTIIQKEYQLSAIGFYFTNTSKEVFQFNGRFLPVKSLEEIKELANSASWERFLNPEIHD